MSTRPTTGAITGPNAGSATGRSDGADGAEPDGARGPVTPDASTRVLTRALVDDAAIFPPGNAALPEAVAGHRTHRAAWYADVIGPLLIRLSDAEDLHALTTDGEGLAVTLICPPTATAGQIDAAIAVLADAGRSRVVGIEQPLTADVLAQDPALRDGARRAARAVVGLGVPVWFEIPQSSAGDGTLGDWLEVVESVGARAKYRTGGVRPDLFPTEVQVARFIRAATARHLPFKLTAGLHHAVRHTGADTGFEHHGVLNVLAATGVSVAAGPAAAGGPDDGPTTDAMVALLAERDGATVAAAVTGPGAAGAREVREAFVSFGCCGVTDPVDDLVTLGLLADGGAC